MNRQLLKDSAGWGILLWLLGYLLGILLFFLVDKSLIGWIITPIGIVAAVWILRKKTRGSSFFYYFLVATVWTVIAIVFDYLFIIRLLGPEDGYYKTDVYLYYALTFVLPLLLGRREVRAG